MSTADLLVIAPLIAAVLVAAAIIVADLIRPGDDRLATGVSLLGARRSSPPSWSGSARRPGTAFGGAYRVDALTTFLDLLFVAIVALTILFGPDYLVPRGLPVAEFAAILVFALTGAMLIAGSADLLVLFLGLELMVIPGYLLAGFDKRDALSTEGAIKYFLLGSFSSAIFLFGLAFVWGLTGSTRIADVAAQLAPIVQGQAALSAGLAMGLAFLTTGVAFKIAAVPFHYWTPDAYQGSPTPITGYLSVGPKIGAFAVILRVFAEALGAAPRGVAHRLLRPRGADDDAGQPGRPHPGQRQADAGLLARSPTPATCWSASPPTPTGRSRASRGSSSTAPRTPS